MDNIVLAEIVILNPVIYTYYVLYLECHSKVSVCAEMELLEGNCVLRGLYQWADLLMGSLLNMLLGGGLWLEEWVIEGVPLGSTPPFPALPLSFAFR